MKVSRAIFSRQSQGLSKALRQRERGEKPTLNSLNQDRLWPLTMMHWPSGFRTGTNKPVTKVQQNLESHLHNRLILSSQCIKSAEIPTLVESLSYQRLAASAENGDITIVLLCSFIASSSSFKEGLSLINACKKFMTKALVVQMANTLVCTTKI